MWPQNRTREVIRAIQGWPEPEPLIPRACPDSVIPGRADPQLVPRLRVPPLIPGQPTALLHATMALIRMPPPYSLKKIQFPQLSLMIRVSGLMVELSKKTTQFQSPRSPDGHFF